MPQQSAPPTIGIPIRLAVPADVIDNHAEARGKLFEDIVGLIEGGGGRPVRLDPDDVANGALSRCDGFVLPGGGDVDPSRYGGPASDERLQGVSRDQDALDVAVARFASDTERPLLAICRGMQVLNVSRGGSLHVDLPPSGVTHSTDFTDEIAWSEHSVEIDPHSLCARSFGGLSSMQVACSHHQAIDQVGNGLRVSARAGDGCIEAVEQADSTSWLLGVQWHPEAETEYAREAQQPLFSALVAAAESRR